MVKPNTFDDILKANKRKQVPLCHNCHVNVEKGRYDNLSIKELSEGWILSL